MCTGFVSDNNSSNNVLFSRNFIWLYIDWFLFNWIWSRVSLVLYIFVRELSSTTYFMEALGGSVFFCGFNLNSNHHRYFILVVNVCCFIMRCYTLWVLAQRRKTMIIFLHFRLKQKVHLTRFWLVLFRFLLHCYSVSGINF